MRAANPDLSASGDSDQGGFYTWSAYESTPPRIQIVMVQKSPDGERLDMPVEHGTHAQTPRIGDTGKQLRL